ncbi:MAG: NADase-type glycan-binding domain-containing protein [Hyphomicrobiaceae bacterium]
MATPILIAGAALLIAQGPGVQAQQVKTIRLGKNAGGALSFHGTTNGRLRTFASDNEARGVVRSVLAAMGLPLRFEVRAAAVGNAAAILQPDGTRLILYNTLFIDEIQARTGRYWSLISIMAHEIGHHLAFHLAKHIEDHEAELEADYFSGYILAKMGASKDDALAAMNELAADAPTKTHPGRKERLQAIAAGWKNGREGVTAKPVEALSSVPRVAAPKTVKSSRGLTHRASPRANADACADNLGTFYCVSSYLPTSGVNRSDYGPASLFDGSDRTAWVEGRTARRDDGIGEWILLDWQRERRIRGFTLKNGYWKSKRLFAANGRVTRLRARFSSGRTVEIALRDSARQQSVALRKPEPATWVQLEILKAKRGTKYSDTAITELQPRFD